MANIIYICFYLWIFYVIYSLWKGYIETDHILNDFKFITKFKKNPEFSKLDAIYLLGQKYGYEKVYKTLKRKKLLDDRELVINPNDKDI